MAGITSREDIQTGEQSLERMAVRATERETESSFREGFFLPGSVAIPRSLSRRFSFIEPLDSGGEARLFLVGDSGTTRRMVLKIYREGLRPNVDVLERVRRSSPEHVVGMLEHGEEEGCYYELLEFSEHGTLSDFLESGSPVPPDMCKEILKEVASALEHVHTPEEGRYIVHRDIKPGNILIKRRKPLDLVLIDFGISELVEGPVQEVLRHGSVPYSAPENHSGLIGPESDYWSLGMLIFELLSGRHPFEGRDDNIVRLQLVTDWHPDLSAIPSSWADPIQGLLCREPAQRWGADEIRRWLGGEEVAPPRSRGAAGAASYSFQGHECRSARQLAAALMLQWADAAEILESSNDVEDICRWLEDELGDRTAGSRVRELVLRRDLSRDLRLLYLLYALEPSLPAVWKGFILNAETLTELCDTAMRGDTSVASLIRELFEQEILIRIGESSDHGWLRDAGEAWRRAAEEYEESWKIVSRYGGPVDVERPLADVLPQLYLAACNTARAASARSRLGKRVAAIVFCHPWFSRLGSPDTLSAGRLVAGEIIAVACAASFPDNHATSVGSWERVEARELARSGGLPPTVQFSVRVDDIDMSLCGTRQRVGKRLRLDWHVQGAARVEIDGLSRSLLLVRIIRTCAAVCSMLGAAALMTYATSVFFSDGPMIAFMGVVLVIIGVVIWVAGINGVSPLAHEDHRELPLGRGTWFTLTAVAANGDWTVSRTPWFDVEEAVLGEPLPLPGGREELAGPIALQTPPVMESLHDSRAGLHSPVRLGDTPDLTEALKLDPPVGENFSRRYISITSNEEENRTESKGRG